MNGLRLASMPAPDMLDVFHFFFEDDFAPTSYEQAQVRSKIRDTIYGDMYKEGSYKYSIGDSTSGSSHSRKYTGGGISGGYDFEPEDEKIVPFDPIKKPTKPYVSPTKFDPDSDTPFGSILDGPLTK